MSIPLGTVRAGESVSFDLPGDIPQHYEALHFLHIHSKLRGRRHDAPAFASWMTWSDFEHLDLELIRATRAMENLAHRREVSRQLPAPSSDYFERGRIMRQLEEADDVHWDDE